MPNFNGVNLNLMAQQINDLRKRIHDTVTEFVSHQWDTTLPAPLTQWEALHFAMGSITNTAPFTHALTLTKSSKGEKSIIFSE